MELRVLHYFTVIAHLGSFTKAAAELHITQPTLSRQIMHLEEELGGKLFIREETGLRLTEQGLRFLEESRELLTMAEAAKIHFQHAGEALTGTISIGCIEAEASLLLMDCIASFLRMYPQIRIDIYTGFRDDIKRRLDEGSLNIALLGDPIERSKYESLDTGMEEQWGVFLKASHPLAARASLAPEELLDKPLLMPGRSAVQEKIVSWFGAKTENVRICGTYNLLSASLLFLQYLKTQLARQS